MLKETLNNTINVLSGLVSKTVKLNAKVTENSLLSADFNILHSKIDYLSGLLSGNIVQPIETGTAIGFVISNAIDNSFNGEYRLLDSSMTDGNRVFYYEQSQYNLPFQIIYDTGAYLPDNKPNSPSQGWIIKDQSDAKWYADVPADATIEQIASANWVGYYATLAAPTINVLYE